MESLRAAANVAASYVGLESSTDETNTSHIGGGQAPQNTMSSNSQSGVEPVSGIRGAGTAGEPFDAGNQDNNAGCTTSTRSNVSAGAAPQQTSSLSGTQSGRDPLSGVRGAGTAAEPYDRGNSGLSSGVGASSNTRVGPTSTSTSKTSPGHDTDSAKTGGQLGSDVNRSVNSTDRQLFDRSTAPGAGGVGVDNDRLTNRSVESVGSGLGGARGGIASDRSAGVGSGAASGFGTGSSSGIGSGSGINNGSQSTRSTGEAMTGNGLGSSSRGLGRDGVSSTTTGGSGMVAKAEQKIAEHVPSSATNDSVRSTAAPQSSAVDNVSRTSTTGQGVQDTRDVPVRTKDIAAAEVGKHSHGHSHGTSTGQVGGYTDDIDGGCDQEAHGYEPHGGHPTGERAHEDGHPKPTFLQWRGEQNNPLGQAD